jgi:alpha-ribazole phosphatase
VSRVDVWVVRHAPVAATGLCYGQSEVRTTLDATAAADTIVRELEGLGALATLERIWTSPWDRTRSVAGVLGDRLGLPVEVDERLSELSFGAWEGRTYADIEATDHERFARWMASWETAAPPGGETLAQLLERIAAWRAGVTTGGLAIAHAGPIRALRALARGVAYSAVVKEPVEHLRVEPLLAKHPREP